MKKTEYTVVFMRHGKKSSASITSETHSSARIAFMFRYKGKYDVILRIF